MTLAPAAEQTTASVAGIARTSPHVFTERDPTAARDIEALRAVFHSNGDGVLNASDAAFADFKLMVTNADGSTSVMTLAAAGITEEDRPVVLAV